MEQKYAGKDGRYKWIKVGDEQKFITEGKPPTLAENKERREKFKAKSRKRSDEMA